MTTVLGACDPGDQGGQDDRPASETSAPASSATSVATSTAPPPAVPAAFGPLYESVAQQLSSAARDPRLSGDRGVATTWAVDLIVANGNRGAELLDPRAIDGVVLMLDRAVALGVSGVTVDVKYPLLLPWFARSDEYARFYQRVGQEARRRALTVFADIGPVFGGTVFSDVPLDPARLTFDQFAADLAAMGQRTIDLMSPAWLGILGEPDTAVDLTGIRALGDADQLVAFVNRVADGIDRRTTKLVAGTGTWMPPHFVTKLAAQSRIDAIGLHLYPVAPGVIDTMVAGADAARRAGKQVVFDEAWLYKLGPGEGGGPAAAADVFHRDAFSFWQPLDIEFLGLVDRIARSQGVSYMSVFWSGLLFSYLDWTPERDRATYAAMRDELARAQVDALVARRRSPTGEAFATMIKRR